MTYAVYVCGPRVLALARRVVRCHLCRRRTRHVVALYAWYESSLKCCACGALDGRRGDCRIETAGRQWLSALPWREAAAPAGREIRREKS